MAFACFKDSEIIYSFQYNLKDWIALKEDKNSVFKMPCCDNKAILKTSKLGTQFFAHKVKPKSSNCSTGGESTEHMHIKYLVMRELNRNDWSVQVEKAGVTPTGEGWIADIYAEKGTAKIAIEVQWSPQSFIELRRRQAKYKESGVRCAWLLRSSSIKARDAIVGDYAYSTKEVPVFSIYKASVNDDKAFMVYNIYKINADSNKIYGHSPITPLALRLEDFVKRLSSGCIKFIPKHSPSEELFLKVSRLSCWECGRKTNVVVSVNFKWSVFGVNNEYTRHSKLVHQCGINIINLINENFAKLYNFAPLRIRYSNTLKDSYIANSCTHCDALMGWRFILSWSYCKTTTTKSIRIKSSGHNIMANEDFNTGKWILVED